MDAFGGRFDAAGDALVSGRRERGARRRRVRAAVGHAPAFDSWRSLVREQRLTEAEAIELMVAVVRAAGSD